MYGTWDTLRDITLFAAITASLGWSFYTSRDNRKARRDMIRLHEFMRIRMPVDAAYTAIGNHCASLRNIERGGGSTTQLRNEVSDCNKTFSRDYSALYDALGCLDRNPITAGRKWAQGTVDLWDQIALAFNSVYASQDLGGSRDAINRIITKIDLLLTHVLGELDKEIP